MLQVRDLKKQYKHIEAVKGVSFSVSLGEIVGLLGPNGAGKTTTISMLLGVLTPTSGSITLDGVSIEDRSRYLSRTNFAAVYAQLPSNMTVAQNLRIFGMLYDVPHLTARIDAVLQEFDLERFRDTKTGLLSSGEQTRVVLAKAMLNKPSLLLLDEPTASLDPNTARIIRDKIKHFARNGGAVLWTSHNMQEVTEVCSRVLFMSKGSVLLEGDPVKLPEAHGEKDLEALFIAVANESLETSDI